MIDFARLKIDALASMRSIVEQLCPGGMIRGNEYVCRNPTRQDSAPGSFSINLKTGVWADFATDSKGGDPISLVAYLNNCRQGEAARSLSTMLGRDYSSGSRKREPYNPADWVPLSPVPADAPALPTERAQQINGEWVRFPITHYWRYTDRVGNTIGYVVRYETVQGKETPPMTLKRNMKTGEMKWSFHGIPKPRPLFNLARLVGTQNPQVIVVEGEKCAEVLQTTIEPLSPSIVVISWPGGAKSIAHADWSPIAHASKIILWPDNTADHDPGYETMLRIASIIRSLGCKAPARIVRKQSDRPDGWDCADAVLQLGWNAHQCLAFIRDQSDDLPAKLPAVNLPAPERQRQPAREPVPDDPDTRPYRVLGYDADNTYFYPARTCMVTRIASSNLGKKSHLYTIAQPHHWENTYPGTKGPSWDAAAAALNEQAHQVGPFNVKKIRGRGVWIDDTRNVVNLGRTLVINGESVPLQRIKSDYVYQSGAMLEHLNASPLADGAGDQLRQICKELFWESDLYGDFLAGWLVIAPICGGLSTRPHVWLTGPSQAGKTSVFELIIKPCLGELALYTQSNTSEAGIRQQLGHDALPVVIDEFESEDADDLKRVEKILILARQAFSGETPIIKGGQHGQAHTYLVRSCFFMSSINVSISQRADKTRILVLRMKEPHTRFDLTPKQQWEGLRQRIRETLTPEWCSALRARSISLLPVINQNAETFSGVISEHLSNSRSGDQMGPILAGLYSLRSSGLISREEAAEIVGGMRWTDHVESNEENERDEYLCLRKIVSASIRINHGEYSIAEMIDSLINAQGDSGDDYRKALARYGLKVSENRQILHVSKDQTNIEIILEKTPWKKSYFELLKRMAGSMKTSQLSIDNVRRQCVNIPIIKILG